MGYFADAIRIAKHRWRFRKSPVGYWSSRAGGGGFDMVHWLAVQFRADGTGRVQYSGIILEPQEYPPGDHCFKWRSVGKRRIEIQLPEITEWEAICYDFSIRRDEYNLAEVCPPFSIPQLTSLNP